MTTGQTDAGAIVPSDTLLGGWVWLKCADCGCAWKSCQDSDSCPECSSPHGHDIIDGDDAQTPNAPLERLREKEIG